MAQTLLSVLVRLGTFEKIKPVTPISSGRALSAAETADSSAQGQMNLSKEGKIW
jgi:hypothetical protein